MFEEKRTGFFSRLITKPANNNSTPQPPQPLESKEQLQPIDQSIHWIIHNNLNDWQLIFELADRLSNNHHQEDQPKSIKTIKNYYLKPTQNTQYLIPTIRLIVILLLNSSDQFGQLAAKKLIKPIQDLFNKACKSVHGQPIQEIIIKAFAVLGFEFQHHENLQAFTRFYNKIRPEDAPENGTPLVDSDGLFAPISNKQTTQRSHPAPHHNGIHQAPITLVRDVRAEAEIARNHARLLLEALAFTPPSEMDSNQIIQEFHSNCLQSQNQLLDDIPWATEQATRARENLSKQHEQQMQLQQAQLEANHDLRPIEQTLPTESTREEQLLEILLSANNELTAAFKQYDELERLAREEKEVKAVEERSKVETRLNRNSPAWLTTQTTEYPRQSGSSNPSPRHSYSHEPTTLPPSGSTEDVKFSSHRSHQEGYDVPDHFSSSSTDKSSRKNLQEFRHRESPDISSPNDALNHHHYQELESDAESAQIVTPVERSEKSLGKMRRISNGISNSSAADPFGALDILHHPRHRPENSTHHLDSSNSHSHTSS